VALTSGSWRELIEIEIREHPNGIKIIHKGCKTGKLPRNPCVAWRHGACCQAPSQQYYFCVVARDSEDVGDFEVQIDK